MTIISWKRPSTGQGTDLSALREQVIGNAIVVHLADRVSDEAAALAMRVARDPHHDLVVVDLPPGGPVSLWNELADLLPRRRRGVRIVVGGRNRETTTLAGQWLAERLGRSVVAPDGAVRPGAGGSLFVHSGRGSGWVRFRPGKAPRWEAKRFPQPQWDGEVPAEDWPTSARGIAEPIPGGIWVRPVGHEPQQREYRRRLIEGVPCQDKVITVVVGCPGYPPLSLDDLARLWMRLPGSVREWLRFVQFGPVAVPSTQPSLGQALADCIGERVACYTGMPVGDAPVPDVHTVDDRGGLGWYRLVRELGYRPGSDGATQPPALLSHRCPVPGMPKLSPAVYWYAPDAVVEVVQSGLWIRSPEAGEDATAVRCAPVDRGAHNLIFDGDRMRLLAQDVLPHLHPSTRQVSRLLPVHALRSERDHVRLAGPARAELDPARPVGAEPGPVELTGPTGAEVGPAQPIGPTSAEPDPVQTAGHTGAEVDPTPLTDLAASGTEPGPTAPGDRPTAEPATAEAAALAPAQAAPEPPALPSPEPPPSEPAPPDIGPGVPPGFRLESAAPPDHGPARAVDRPHRTVDRPAPPATVDAEPGTGVQPTPDAAAAALLPDRDLDQERAWLRRTLGPEYGTHANALSRVLSVHPGFQGPLKSASPDALTDAVAVRLHLAAHGAAIDLALRTATVGPHVPFGRCVVSGLGKLPSHRGPTVFRAEPTQQQLRLYQERNLVTDWGFVHALTAPCAKQTGSTDVLIWSMTARRTRLLEPDECRTEDRVLFLPGTSFKVLRVRPPTAGARGRILLRELAAGEIGVDGRVEAGPVPLDELAMSSLEGQLEQWTATEPRPRVPEAAADRFGALPGLIVRRGDDR